MWHQSDTLGNWFGDEAFSPKFLTYLPCLVSQLSLDTVQRVVSGGLQAQTRKTLLELGQFQPLTTQSSCCGKEVINGNQPVVEIWTGIEGLWLSDWDLCVKKEISSLWTGRKRETDRNFKKSLDGIKKYEYVCTRTHVRQLLGVSIPGALPCWIVCLCYKTTCCFLLSLQDITKRHFVWTSKFASERFSQGKNPWEMWLYMYARTRKQEMYQLLREKRGECLQFRKGSQYFLSMYLLVHCSLTSFPQTLLPLDFLPVYQQTITLPTALK